MRGVGAVHYASRKGKEKGARAQRGRKGGQKREGGAGSAEAGRREKGARVGAGKRRGARRIQRASKDREKGMQPTFATAETSWWKQIHLPQLASSGEGLVRYQICHSCSANGT